SESLSLKKAGRNFKTNCPFHNEKTPSFVVSPERQIWHCFGCAKGGDAFTFLMEYDHLEFPEALRILAKRAGVELKDTDKKGTFSKKEKIYKINNQAAKFYNYILLSHPAGKKALDYLVKQREISIPLARTFMLGFSPVFGTALSDYLLKKKNWQKNDLIEAGISFFKNGRLHDFFRGRLIFPLTDHNGSIVGFSARALGSEMPKYINTRDTIAYHKGKLFFGLDIAKEDIKKHNQAVVVEGEFDVISSFKEGFRNVIAIKGTALTESQVVLLSRFTEKVTLFLDQDKAGFEAIKRSLSVLERKNLTTTVAFLADGKDPDEIIKKDPIVFKKAIKNDIPVYEFLIDETLKKQTGKNADSKKKITDELLPFFALIENEIIKEHYLKALSKKIDTSFESLLKEVDKIKSGKKDDLITYSKKDKRTRREILEEYLLALIVQSENPKTYLETLEKELKEYVFEVPSYGKILEKLKIFASNVNDFKIEVFAKNLSAELIKVFDACYLMPINKFEKEEKFIEEINIISKELITIFIKEKIKNLKSSLKEKPEKEMDNINQEIAKYINILSKLPKASD
ncbi:DNA primase, partial [Patescibacteria group bacterium]|nr:DNA primase [Patescibacteria group bacterium]